MLATDQSTTTETGEDGKTVVKEYRTVTLEVTPRIAEKIAVAQTLGTIGLALRSIADNQTDLERAVAAGNVVVPDNATPEEEERLIKAAMARPDDTRGSFVTGGDVSRYQRSSVPPKAASSQGPAMVSGGQVASGSAPIPTGPVVRVTRGKDTEAVAVGSGK